MPANRLDQIREFLRESPEDAFLLFALAQEYIKTGRFTEALDNFSLLHKLHPDYVALYYHYARLAYQEGRSELAMTLFKEGMERAKAAGDMHAYGELQGAMMEVEGD